jgi:hypothetical protein
MNTVTYPSPVSKAYYAWLDETHGVVAKVDGELLFMADDGTLTVIEPPHLAFLTANGQVGLADTQLLMDQIHGGYAAIACRRAH